MIPPWLRVRRPRFAWQVGAPDPWPDLLRKLTWQYGPERAEEILEETDEATAADLAAWRSLGEAK